MTIQALLTNILNLINIYVIPLLVAVAIVVFFFGIVKFIFASGGEGKTSALKLIGNGILGLVVMLSIWGIVALVGSSLGISGQVNISLPQVH